MQSNLSTTATRCPLQAGGLYRKAVSTMVTSEIGLLVQVMHVDDEFKTATYCKIPEHLNFGTLQATLVTKIQETILFIVFFHCNFLHGIFDATVRFITHIQYI